MAKSLSKKSTQPLKKSTLGLEVELFILDKNGKIVNEADLILNKIAEKKQDEAKHIIEEGALNIIEVGSYPNTAGPDSMLELLNNLKLLVYTAEELNLWVLPLATYPGKYSPKFREDTRYKIQQRLFGKTRFDNAGRCAGYHCHYALPWGVFDNEKLTLKELSDSKNQESLVNAYNFLIALDPVLTTFMQSSPFYQGQHLAKDSRMLAYRGGEELNYPDGVYANLPKFGALPSYEHTGTDILHLIKNRNKEWLEMLATSGIAEKDMPKYKSELDTNWSPVKVNAHGTLEQRGMDMNHLPILFAVSVMIRRLLRHIQEDYIKVLPHDSAKIEPFKLDRKTIYIPPDTYVKKTLQNFSAYKGLENDEMHNYCKRLINLLKTLEGKKVEWLIEPLEKMLAERQTIADKIIGEAGALGHKDLKKPIADGIAEEISINHAKQLFKDMVIVEKMIKINK